MADLSALETLRRLIGAGSSFLPTTIPRIHQLAREHARRWLCAPRSPRPVEKAAASLVLLLEAFRWSAGTQRRLAMTAASRLCRSLGGSPMLYPLRVGDLAPALGIETAGLVGFSVSPEGLRPGELDRLALTAAWEALHRCARGIPSWPEIGIYDRVEDAMGWTELARALGSLVWRW